MDNNADWQTLTLFQIQQRLNALQQQAGAVTNVYNQADEHMFGVCAECEWFNTGDTTCRRYPPQLIEKLLPENISRDYVTPTDLGRATRYIYPDQTGCGEFKPSPRRVQKKRFPYSE